MYGESSTQCKFHTANQRFRKPDRPWKCWTQSSLWSLVGVRFKIRVSIGARSGLSLGVHLGIGVGVDLGPAPDLIRNISGYLTREIKNNDESK